MDSTPSLDWNDQRIDLLTTLWADGKSGTEIAGELGGGLTRSAVLGKVHRLGLPQRQQRTHTVVNKPRNPKPPREKPAGKRKVAKELVFIFGGGTSKPPTPVAPPVLDDQAIPLEQRKSLIELTADTCRFPVGDPGEASFFFCGGQVRAQGEPYCVGHAARCFEKRERIR